MDYDFTELEQPILDRLGFAAIHGLKLSEFLAFAQNLYKELHPEAGVLPVSIETSSDPHNQSRLGSSAFVSSTLFCESNEWKSSLWGYLITLPDFVVGPEDEGKHLTLADIEALPVPPDETTPDEDADRESGAIPRVQQMKAKPAPNDAKPSEGPPPELSYQPRVFASRDRIWRTITGHPVDWVRLPPKEFQALCVISAAGKDGIQQPAVTQITGQDKKSLPRRTYALEAKGYIEKRPIISLKNKTMHLTHKKFVDKEMAGGTHYTQVIARPILLNDELVPGSCFWTGSVIYEDALMRSMVNLVESWGVIDMIRLKLKLGVGDSSRLKKLIRDRVARFCHIGMFEESLGQEPGSTKVTACLKFCRRPTEVEWKTECERRPASDIVPTEIPSKPMKSNHKKKATHSAKKRSSKAKNDRESEIREPEQSLGDETQLDGLELGTGEEDRPSVELQRIETPPTDPNTTTDPISTSLSNQVAIDVPSPKNSRPRGRPPKRKASVAFVNDPSDIPEPELPKRRGRPPGRKDSAPRAIVSRRSQDSKPREAIFTSYQDLQRDKGIPGVYINPSRSNFSTDNEEILVVVFKTNLLKTWNSERQTQNDPVSKSILATGPPSSPRTSLLTAKSGVSQELYQSSNSPTLELATPIALSVSANSSPLPNLVAHDAQGSISEISSSCLQSNQTISSSQVFQVLEHSLQEAAEITLPNDAVSILALWNQTPGKLCLTEDKKSVIFYAAEASPALEIETCTISPYPEVVKTTSVQAELRITGEGFEHMFLISASEESTSAANILRAKIVNALLTEGLRKKPSTTPKDNDKPWQCEICLKRWRNDNGLLYHQTKSRSTCNPNWRPEEASQTSKLSSGAEPLDGLVQNLGNRTSNTPPTATEDRDSTLADDILSDSANTKQGSKKKRKTNSVSVEDSDFLPEEPISKRRKVRTPNGKELIVASGPTTPLSKSTVDSDTDMDLEIGSDDGGDSPPLDPEPPPRGRKRKKGKAAIVPGSRKYIKEILIYLVMSNGGMFPGGKSLWIAIIGESQKRCPNLAYPTRFIFQNTLKTLLGSRSLKRETCSFKTKLGLMAKYEVVLRTTPQPNSDALDQLKNHIKESWPDSYVPPPFNPSESLLAEVDKMEEEEKQKKTAIKILENPYYLERAAIRQSAADKEENLDDGDSDESHSEQEDLRDSIMTEADAVSMEESLADQNVPESEPFELVPEILPAFLQSPVTGFWDATPAVTAEKKRKNYTRRVQIPEVVTYMQSYNDPTWSHQPFGHGARPLYTRPGRRVEGNPRTDIRLQKIQEGHRPVIEPIHKMIAPARPSKLIFRPFSEEEFARNYDASLPPAKRQRLAKEREKTKTVCGTSKDGERKRSSTCAVHVAHQRPTSMKPLQIIIPPTIKYSTGSISFLPPNFNLGDEEIFTYEASSFRGFYKTPHCLDWNGGEALTWFNPPWESEDDYQSEYENSMKRCNVGRRRRLAQPKSTVPLKNFKTRMLTHLEGDFEKHEDMTGVPIASIVDAPVGKKGAKVCMSPEMENRFVVAHIAIYIIAGGVGKVIDTVLVSRLFPKYTFQKLKELWIKIKKRRGKEIPIIESRFQEAFLDAYEAGLLPAINYDDLLNYDWDFVVDWYIAKYPVVSGGLEDGLPSSRSLLLEKYEIADMELTENWQDLFVSTSTGVSKSKRHQLSCKDQLTISLHPTKRTLPAPDEAATAVSVVRANLSTPLNSYNPDIAKEKLLKIGETAVENAKVELIQSKSITLKNKGRAVPGQPYILTEAFFRPLHKQPIKFTTFAEARKYKEVLDAAFRKGDSVNLACREKNGAFMCVTNLLANDRIRLVQSNVPLNRFGLLQNTYETNNINKSQLLFVLDVVPTDSYLYNDQLNLSFEAPRGVGDAIPAWLDINGNLLPDFWQKVQEAVFGCLALRPGAIIAELTKTFHPSLRDWELRVLVDWGTEVGALKKVSGCHEGWMTGEWWWMIPGAGVL